MKKKLLLLAMMAIVACLLVLSISAAGSTSNEFANTPDTIDGIATPTKIGTSERVVMLGNDGLYYTFPAYYILNDNTSCSFKTNNSVNSVLGYADGTSHKSYVVRIEIPEGITYINGNLLDCNTNLVYAKMSNTVTNTGAKVFQGCTNLETLILSSNLTVIQNDLCKGCSKLTSPIVIPATVTAINGYCFDGCKIPSITNYAENVKSIAGNAFSGCPITEFNFPDSLESIGQYAFNGTLLTSVDLPNSITSLGSGVFQGCTRLSYIRLPENLTQVPHDFLKNTTGSSITIVVPKGCTSIYSQYSLNNSGIKKIIFTGSSTDAFVASVQEKASGWVSKIVYENHCHHYYNDVHNDTDNNPCWLTSCDRCGAENQYCGNENTHSLTSIISYADYTKFGTKTESCSNDNCTHKDVVVDSEIAPIFTYRGYSSSYTTGKICVGYAIDQKALDEYGSDKISYGAVAYAPKDGETNLEPVIVNDGEIGKADGAIVAELETTYSGFDFFISGFETEAHYALELVMCMFIYDGTDVDYVCPVDGEAVQMEYANTIVFADHIQ